MQTGKQEGRASQGDGLVLQVAPEVAPQVARTVILFALSADLAVLLAFVFGPLRR